MAIETCPGGDRREELDSGDISGSPETGRISRERIVFSVDICDLMF